VDLARIDDRDLSDEARLRAFLKALKYIRRRDLAACIDLVLAEAPVLEDRDLFVILTYLDKGSVAVSNTVMSETLQRLLPDRKERIMGWLTQPYYETGYEKGKAQGEAEGEAKGEARGEARGEAKVLTRLLERRFGSVPLSIRERIFAADIGTIEAWVDRAFDAPNLQSVFEPS
jgi:hypothetical protein